MNSKIHIYNSMLKESLCVSWDLKIDWYIYMCFLMQSDDDCCNSCDEVRDAYRKKGWALTNADLIDQVSLWDDSDFSLCNLVDWHKHRHIMATKKFIRKYNVSCWPSKLNEGFLILLLLKVNNWLGHSFLCIKGEFWNKYCFMWMVTFYFIL